MNILSRLRLASSTPVTLIMLLCVLVLSNSTLADDRDHALINAALDDFHAAAADADRDRYLGHFAPNGVFMGTDDWERWPLAEFTEYVEGRFSTGVGWKYVSEERHVDFSGDGNTAWFDEIMVNERWGRFRGTGVMIRIGSDWKLAHYSLTALVPNEQFEAVANITNAGFESRKADDKEER